MISKAVHICTVLLHWLACASLMWVEAAWTMQLCGALVLVLLTPTALLDVNNFVAYDISAAVLAIAGDVIVAVSIGSAPYGVCIACTFIFLITRIIDCVRSEEKEEPEKKPEQLSLCTTKRSTGLSCNHPTLQGSPRCALHTCAMGACTKSKAANATFCTSHTPMRDRASTWHANKALYLEPNETTNF